MHVFYRLGRSTLLCGAAIAAFLACATSVAAQDAVFELFWNDYSADRAQDAGAFGVEYRLRPFATPGRVALRLVVGGTVDGHGNVWAGAGPAAEWSLGPRWFLEASILPGLYHPAGGGFDLGNDLEFRTTLALGYRLDDRSSLALALRHISNGETSPINPGLNAIGLRLYRSF